MVNFTSSNGTNDYKRKVLQELDEQDENHTSTPAPSVVANHSWL